MESSILTSEPIRNAEWYSDDYIHQSVVQYLKQNGYKIQKDAAARDTEKQEKTIVASKFFKKEVIEIKGFPNNHHNALHATQPKSVQAKSWFTEALFNSFVNFSSFDNAEVAMAVPNVSRYQAIIKNLQDYFTANELYFRVYLVNEDGSVEVSNLNHTYGKVNQ